MILRLQIISSLFSLIFGFSFSFILYLCNKIIYNKYKFIRLLGSFLIILLSSLIYFFTLSKINNSIFHPYLLILIIAGYVLHNFIHKRFITIVKRHKR